MLLLFCIVSNMLIDQIRKENLKLSGSKILYVICTCMKKISDCSI